MSALTELVIVEVSAECAHGQLLSDVCCKHTLESFTTGFVQSTLNVSDSSAVGVCRVDIICSSIKL